jgi:hypothetical protein
VDIRNRDQLVRVHVITSWEQPNITSPAGLHYFVAGLGGIHFACGVIDAIMEVIKKARSVGRET